MASDTNTSVVYVRIPAALHRRFRKVAAANRRSVNQEAQVAFERHVAAEKEKKQ